MLVMAHQPEIQVGHGEVRSPREYSLVGCGGLGQLAVVAQFAPELEIADQLRVVFRIGGLRG